MDAFGSTQVLYPALRYKDAIAAIYWLKRAFGFEECALHNDGNGLVAHAQLSFNGALIMLASSAPGSDFPVRSPLDAAGLTASIYAYTPDPDGLYARAKEAGARIVREPADTDYGSREFSAADCEGQLWTFGTYRP
jgi:uncharacterized glyoxalase superfamily protein PhnB